MPKGRLCRFPKRPVQIQAEYQIKKVIVIRGFFVSKLSESISETPEGYLICKKVPIARTGTQDYLGEELGLDDLYGQLVPVYRSPEQVFDPVSMASFEDKPVANEHPSEEINAENSSIHQKGTTINVRRGLGDDEDKLMADLIIYDKLLADEIVNGKREISYGYNCDYVFNDQNGIDQQKIRGNHGAVVAKGRAGSQVAIKDTKPQQAAPVNNKSKKKRNSMGFLQRKRKPMMLPRLLPV